VVPAIHHGGKIKGEIIVVTTIYAVSCCWLGTKIKIVIKKLTVGITSFLS